MMIHTRKAGGGGGVRLVVSLMPERSMVRVQTNRSLPDFRVMRSGCRLIARSYKNFMIKKPRNELI